MKKFIFIILANLIACSNIYAQVIEQVSLDLPNKCNIITNKNFIINHSSDAWRYIDCNLSRFDFNKFTILGFVKSTCGHDEGGIVVKILRDDNNKKYIIKSRFQKDCLCKSLRIGPETRIIYTEKFKEYYKIEYEYLKPSS